MKRSSRLYRVVMLWMLVLCLPLAGMGTVFAEDVISKLVLSKNEVSLEVGDTYSLTATAVYESGSTSAVTVKTDWNSGDTSIASVYAGAITAKKEGSTVITASYSGKTVIVNVTVQKKATSLTKNKTNVSLRVGAEELITLMATYSDSTTANVTSKAEWSTSDDSVATVTMGQVTGIATGTATITAKYGSQVVTVPVSVDAVRRLESEQTDLAMKVGGKQQMKLMALFENGDYEDISDKAEWSSNKEDVADAFKGLITAYGTGEATITARYGTKSVSFIVDVDIPKRLEASPTELYMKVNENKKVTLKASYADGTSEDVSEKADWESDNEEIAGVNKGTVTAYTSGRATVTGYYGGKTTSVTVDVDVARKLELDTTSVQLKSGNSAQVKLTATYADGTTEDVTERAQWSSDKENVAIVSKGKISAFTTGEATVTASFGSNTAKLVVDVDVARGLTLDKTNVSLRTGQSADLTASATLSDGTKTNVTDQAEWSAGDTSIAYVSKGKVTAINSGQTTVTAKYGDKTVTATVSVEIPQQLKPDLTDVYVQENEVKQVHLTSTFSNSTTAEDVTDKAEWSSDHEDIAQVDAKGQITGVKLGQAVITAKYGGKTTTINVDVATPRKLTADKSSLSMRTTGQEQLKVTATYADGQTADVTDKAVWSSDNEEVAMVLKGKVTAYAAGNANISAVLGGKTVKVAVSVDQASALTLSETKLNLQPGDYKQLKVESTFADGTKVDVTDKAVWTSKLATIADVSKGNVHAIEKGETTITASFGDRTVSLKVTVGVVSTLTVSETKVLLDEGKTKQVTVESNFKDGTHKDVTSEAEWTTTSDKIAKVTEGLIKATGSGKAVITVKYGGQTETINVEVEQASRLTLNQKQLIMETGTDAQLQLSATDSERGVDDVTLKAEWSSSSDKVADVVDGLVTANGSGKATITAKYGSKTITIPVEVDIAKKLVVNKKTLSLKTGGQDTLVVTAVFSDNSEKDVTADAEWTTANFNIVDVDAGKATAVGSGKSKLTAKYGGKTISIPVTVDELKYLKLSDRNLVLAAGESKQVKAIATYKDATDGDVSVNGVWKSSNTKVADVKDGVITTYGKGRTTISVKFAGKTTSLQVTVK
ncbi:Ig-like domain-containing protein [Paenibacillus rigui]|uniref:Ig-like domain-containing protein n=1 Tax=Paenibacillus rigui TaxID=554312 RepID=UPI0015C64BAE|nr:Ig-like domain-containing protein [Paenibacillus rigui]